MLRNSFLTELKDGFIHLLYPRLCEGCSKPLLPVEDVLCLSCGLRIPETSYHDIADNETALRFAGRVRFCNATSLAYFSNDGLLQHLMHGLKYKGKKEIGTFLGRRLATALQETDWIKEVDLIVPVPLHPTKEAARGYNQSMLIAAAMGENLGIPATDDLLQRVRETESQTKKTRVERVNNMAGAFEVQKGAQLVGKHILICDDVLTTGATIEACAMALLAGGNVKISIATIGIAVS